MSSGFIPEGYESLKELIERIVERRHGSNAIANITDRIEVPMLGEPIKSEEFVGGFNILIKIKREGEWIDYFEDSERWDSARESTRQALEAGTITAWFRNLNGGNDRIPKDNWIIPEDDSFADSYFTLSCGTLQHGGDRSLMGVLVYISTKEVDKFLKTLEEQSEPNNENSEKKNDIAKALKNKASERGRKGGQQSKLLKGVFKAVQQIHAENNDLKTNQVWVKLSLYKSHKPFLIDEYEIYIDGKELFQMDTKTRRTSSIKKASFPRYVSRANPHPSS
jgi:hypothetical protein